MLHRTEGIVLKTCPFGDADLIVTYLTRDFGLVKTFAKSPRKTKSRFGSSLEPLTQARIAFWGKEDSELPRLTQADIINPFQGIRGSLQCFLRVAEAVELTLAFVPERDASAGAYGLLLGMLASLEEDCGPGLRMLQYRLQLLERVGYLPRLKGCARCGTEADAFHLAHGAVLCAACSKGAGPSVRISPASISLARNLLAWDASKVGRIKASEAMVAELSKLIDEHVAYVSERKFRTRPLTAPQTRC